MKNDRRRRLAAFTAMILLAGAAARAAAEPTDDADDVAAIRRADADWAAALLGAGVDAWLDYYAADAIVVLPGEPLASGRTDARNAIAHLLARPHQRYARHVDTVEVSRSGNLAYVTGGYELRFAAGTAASAVVRGRLVEIWRKQTDGTWRCIVDTWNPNVEPAPAPPPAPPSSARAAPPPALPEPLPPPSAPQDAAAAGPPAASNGMPTAEEARTAKYGAMPMHYTEAIKQYFQTHLKYPDSVKYQEITAPEPGSLSRITGFLMHEQRLYGWTVKATINALNGDGDYAGLVTYTFLFRGEKLVHTQLPPNVPPH